MPGASDLFGKGGIAEQLVVWQVAGQLLGALLTPALAGIQQSIASATLPTQLTPEALADMVVRNIIDHHEAAVIAARSGLSATDFGRLVLDTGDAPAPQQLMEALRRGIISWDSGQGGLPSALQGLRQGRLRDEWAPLIRELGFVPIPVADAVDAVVEGQISHDQGAQIAYEGGVRADDFQILVNTRGNPPSPVELIDLVRRGFIAMQGTGPDATTLQQGIFEGATKDKWEPLYERMVEALPPPRTVTALLRNGSITDEAATRWFQQAGLSHEAALAYAADAHHQKLAASKELAKGDVLQLYFDQLVTAEQAVTMLAPLGYTAEEAHFELALQDTKRVIQAVNQLIGRLHTLYVNRKIDRTAAINAMNAIGLPDGQQQQLLQTWDVERTSNVKVLSAAEIASAFYYQVMTQSEATTELRGQGYSEFDAWALLSVRAHKALPGKPAMTVTG